MKKLIMTMILMSAFSLSVYADLNCTARCQERIESVCAAAGIKKSEITGYKVWKGFYYCECKCNPQGGIDREIGSCSILFNTCH